MRKDMSKVIVERPRYGGGDQKAFKRAEQKMDLDDLPRHKSMKADYRWNRKELNENLQPLYRYLAKNCGRPWNLVYSEIMEHVNTNSAVQAHILQHLKDDIRTDIGRVVKNGGVFDTKGERIYYSQFYVHPKSGLLCKNKDRDRYKRKEFVRPYVTIDNKHYAKVDGMWYELTIIPFPYYPLQWPVYDCFAKKNLSTFDAFILYGQYVRCSRRQQVRSSVVKSLKLQTEKKEVPQLVR